VGPLLGLNPLGRAPSCHFGYDVPLLTMTYGTIQHREYQLPGDWHSIERLLVSCAGNAATTAFLGFTANGTADDRLDRARLRRLGAGFFRRRRPLRLGRAGAEHLVRMLKAEIYAVAEALRAVISIWDAKLDAR
jgi:hypothetical protein